MKPSYKRTNVALQLSGVFLAGGALLLVFSIFLEMQVMAFVGLGLTFWGAVLALTRNGRYVVSGLLDGSAHATYATLDRILKDQKNINHAYYLPAYPNDVSLPDYLKNLKDPAIYLSEVNAKASIDDLSAGKFQSRNGGFFFISPGAGILDLVERSLKLDLTKIAPFELCEVLPQCLTEILNLAKEAQMSLNESGANFKATGIVYDSLYADNKPQSVSLLGCPLVCAVASAFAKSTGKSVLLAEQTTYPKNTVSVQFMFV